MLQPGDDTCDPPPRANHTVPPVCRAGEVSDRWGRQHVETGHGEPFESHLLETECPGAEVMSGLLIPVPSASQFLPPSLCPPGGHLVTRAFRVHSCLMPWRLCTCFAISGIFVSLTFWHEQCSWWHPALGLLASCTGGFWESLARSTGGRLRTGVQGRESAGAVWPVSWPWLQWRAEPALPECCGFPCPGPAFLLVTEESVWHTVGSVHRHDHFLPFLLLPCPHLPPIVQELGLLSY